MWCSDRSDLVGIDTVDQSTGTKNLIDTFHIGNLQILPDTHTTGSMAHISRKWRHMARWIELLASLAQPTHHSPGFQ